MTDFKKLEIGLFGFGWLLVALAFGADQVYLLEAAFLSIGAAAILRLVSIVRWREEYWSLCNIVAGAGLTSYLLGAFVTLVQHSPSSIDFVLLTGDDFLGRAVAAVAYLSLFYWVLAGLATIENRYWRKSLRRIDEASVLIGKDGSFVLTLCIGAIGALQLALILTGAVKLSGIDVTQDSRLPIFTELVVDLSGPFLALSAWIVGRGDVVSPRLRWVATAAVLCGVPWFGSLGRRVILYGAVTFLTFFFWGRGRKKVGRVVFLAIPVIALVYICTKFFVAMRAASSAYGDIGPAPALSDLFSDAYSMVTTDMTSVEELEAENYASRFFIFGYLCTVLHGLTMSGVQYGKFIFIAIFLCVPSLIYPEKTDILNKYNWGADGKAIINDVLGLPQLDEAWTPFLAAYGDFLWLGAFIYPLFILGLGWAFSRIVERLRHPLFVVASFGVCLMQYLSTETGVSSLILTGRTLVFIYILSWMVGNIDRPLTMARRRRRI